MCQPVGECANLIEACNGGVFGCTGCAVNEPAYQDVHQVAFDLPEAHILGRSRELGVGRFGKLGEDRDCLTDLFHRKDLCAEGIIDVGGVVGDLVG